MKDTNFKRPRTTRPLMVLLRNGWKAGPYRVGALIWTDRGEEGDVVAAEYAS